MRQISVLQVLSPRMAQDNNLDLSIVIPIYNEVESIPVLFGEIATTLAGKNLSYEIIAVDDGSNDGSSQLLAKLASSDSRIKVILLRRNFGQTPAFSAGFHHAKGKIILAMDADGQNDPADIFRVIEPIQKDEADFVSGWRKDRKDNYLSRTLPSIIANYFIRTVTKTKLHDLGCSLKAYRDWVIKDLSLYGEMHRYVGVLVEQMGVRVVEVKVNHRARETGSSKYGFERAFKVCLDLCTVWFWHGFQTKPIYLFGGIGSTLILGAISIEAVVLYERIFQGDFVHRNPLFSIGLFCGVMGVQFIGLGVMTEVIVRIYYESQKKAVYSIKKLINL